MRSSATGVKDLADFLKYKKSQGQRVGLFLGSRTGVLYNGKLYEELRNHTTNAGDLLKLLRPNTPVAQELSKWVQHVQLFINLPPPDRFKKCHDFLGKYFSENAVHSILSAALKFVLSREEDKLMAGLIKAEFFDTIITTNFDTLLEDACNSLGMKKTIDYDLFTYGSYDNDSKNVEQMTSGCGKIVKIFGDCASVNEKTVGYEFSLEADPLLKKFLESTLAKDIVVLGYDATWDKPIEQAFQETDKMLWYVNENRPVSNTYLAQVLKQRRSKYIGELGWNYISFLQTLSNYIGEKVNRKAEIGLSLPLASSQDPSRNKVFISYSRKNKEFLERLQVHLKGLLHVDKDALSITYGEVWDDTEIFPGAIWMEEIRKALAQAKVAVLLVSADFFASKFIKEEELPTLLKAARSGEVEIISVRLGPSVFKYTELSRYQTINDDTELLMGKEPHEQDRVLMKLVERVFLQSDPPNKKREEPLLRFSS